MDARSLVDSARSRASELPLPGLHRPKRRRVVLKRAGLSSLGLVALSAAAYAARMVYNNRYTSGIGTIASTHQLDDGRVVVTLENGTMFVISADDAEQSKVAAELRVHYQVNRLTLGGLPAGRI